MEYYHKKPLFKSCLLTLKAILHARAVKRQLLDLSTKVERLLRPVFVSQKLRASLGIREKKPVLLSQQCVVYKFGCDQCEAGYVGFTTRQLYQRIEEHKKTIVGKHVTEMHGLSTDSISKNFTVLRKCLSKLDCLLHEMLLIKQLKPSLNGQSDSIKSKLF